MIRTKRIPQSDVSLIGVIDATESGSVVYYYRDAEVVAEREEWHRPRWSGDEVETHIKSAENVLRKGGVLLGAFVGDILVGFASLLYVLEGDMAQLANLQVSRDYRRRGIATVLVKELLELASEKGAKSIYVSATPSESAIGFYRRMGFDLAEKVNKELYELEPEDIHMTRPL
jgi:ribosomal protein S18 acetylase RimI-like enzyme